MKKILNFIPAVLFVFICTGQQPSVTLEVGSGINYSFDKSYNYSGPLGAPYHFYTDDHKIKPTASIFSKYYSSGNSFFGFSAGLGFHYFESAFSFHEYQSERIDMNSPLITLESEGYVDIKNLNLILPVNFMMNVNSFNSIEAGVFGRKNINLLAENAYRGQQLTVVDNEAVIISEEGVEQLDIHNWNYGFIISALFKNFINERFFLRCEFQYDMGRYFEDLPSVSNGGVKLYFGYQYREIKR
ncbi:MAG: hypothetical protein H7Y00_10630 [Fimbriimonadaceae bacterium]|nr:hypothetical protein [Chitinophagales bacterium]